MANTIRVKNKDGKERDFKIAIWNQFPLAPDGTRYGWKPLTEIPEEVQTLATKLKAPPALNAHPEKLTSEKTIPVKDLIKQIKKAKSADEVKALVGTDTRVTVLKESQHRISQF